MIFLAKLIGVIITLFGLTVFATPKITEKVFAFFMEGKNLYLAGVIRIVTGVVILLAMSGSLVPTAAFSLGAMLLVSGALIFVIGVEKMKAFIAHYKQMPTLVIRLFGLIAATFGILIFSIF